MMTRFLRLPLSCLGALLLLEASPARADDEVTVAVDSQAFAFSPGNWTGDAGRSGGKFRQSWYPGAYFRVAWTTTSESPTAELLLDTSIFGDRMKNPPELTYEIDGVWTAGVKCTEALPIKGVKGAGRHELTVYFKTSEQEHRWGTKDESGANVVRVTGLKLDGKSKPVPSAPANRWVLIVGDSITEGSAADFGKSDNLSCWSHLVGTALQDLGYDYGVSACGYSGWLRPGDRGGDVPPYFTVTRSRGGKGGDYDDKRSRWNKIDASTSLLDAKGRLSGHGAAGQEPAAILINFGTNDALSKVNTSDLQASITGSLLALRKAAPEAVVFVIVPFGQYAAAELKAGVEAVRAANPASREKLILIDLGPGVAGGLAANGLWSGLHPNLRGHATFAARILARVAPELAPDRQAR